MRIEKQIPHRYRSNDTGRFPTEAWSQIKEWSIGPDGTGLMVGGNTGVCKTRMICERVMQLALSESIPFMFIAASSFAKLVRQQFSDFEPWVASQQISRLAMTPLLILDDLGKQASTPVVEEALFDLVEERSSSRLPMLVTTNATSDELSKMLSPDRGIPLIRRIKEFCTPIVVEKQNPNASRADLLGETEE